MKSLNDTINRNNAKVKARRKGFSSHQGEANDRDRLQRRIARDSHIFWRLFSLCLVGYILASVWFYGETMTQTIVRGLGL